MRRTITSTLDLAELVRNVLATIAAVTTAEAFSLMLHDPERDELVFVASEMLSEETLVSAVAASGVVAAAPDARRLSVGLRLIYVIPHLIVLLFVGLAWLVTAIIAWFAILFTGKYPEGMYRFAVGVMRWHVRVEAYVLLMRDEYPPFTLQA